MLVDDEAGLLLTHVVLVLRLIVERDLQRGALRKQEFLSLALTREEGELAALATLHAEVELVGKRAQ